MRVQSSNSSKHEQRHGRMFQPGLVGRGVRQKGLTVRPGHAMNVPSIKRIQVGDGERE